MEDKGIADEAIKSAKRRLLSAKSDAKLGNYDTAVYDLEMAAEIAFKGLLFSVGVDAPKTHSIGDIVAETIKGNKSLEKIFGADLEKMIGTFNALMNLRPVSGYIFETKSTLKDMEKKYKEHADSVEKIVKVCEDAVASAK